MFYLLIIDFFQKHLNFEFPGYKTQKNYKMSDPVADFLAREQNLFADFDGAPPAAAAANPGKILL